MYEQIAANKRKTFLLLFVAIALLAAVGYAIGSIYGTGPGGPTGGRAGANGGGAPAVGAESCLPQFTQNKLAGSFLAPHAGQTFAADNGLPPAGKPARG